MRAIGTGGTQYEYQSIATKPSLTIVRGGAVSTRYLSKFDVNNRVTKTSEILLTASQGD